MTTQLLVVFVVVAILIIFLVWLTLRCLRKGKPCPCKGRIEGKVVVITGGDSQEGICLTRELCKRGAERVIMAVTDVTLGQDVAVEVRGETNGDVIVEYCDMASIKSVRNFCTKILEQESKIHILINQACVMWHPYRQTAEGHEYHWGVNHLAHFVMTQLLMPLLLRGAPDARVITLSSFKHKQARRIRWEDPDYRSSISAAPTSINGTAGSDALVPQRAASVDTNSNRNNHQTPRRWFRGGSYRANEAFNQSKLANVLFTRELARKMEGTGVNSYSVDPGITSTGVGWHIILGLGIFRLIGATCCWLPYMKTIPNSIQTTLFCACEPELSEESGLYYADCKQALTSEAGASLEDSYRLWEMTERTVGLTS